MGAEGGWARSHHRRRSRAWEAAMHACCPAGEFRHRNPILRHCLQGGREGARGLRRDGAQVKEEETRPRVGGSREEPECRDARAMKGRSGEA
jgi:hypothetical protein